MREIVRKIIINEVAKLLDEDYESVREIAQFANETLVYLAKINTDSILRHSDDISRINYFKTFELSEVYQSSKKEYKKLKSFLTETNIIFYFISKKDHTTGYYSLIPDKKYSPSDYRDIVINYEKSFIGDLQEKLNDYKERNLKFDENYFYTVLYYPFIGPVIHELQHAYDDYRSKGKIYDTKEFKDYINKQEKEEKVANDQDILGELKKYLNFPHEVWARFSSTMSDLQLKTTDFKETPDKKIYTTYKMKPLRSVLKSFYYAFPQWASLYADGNQLSDMQRRLIKAFVQFWHKEQDIVNEKNKNPKYWN